MNFKKTLLSTSIIASLGAGMLAADAAFAGPVNAGSYNLVILPTPTEATTSSQFNFGTDGAWESSFVFAPGSQIEHSRGMTDNGVNLTDADGPGTASRAFGSSIGGDGWAGKLGITISGLGAVTVSSFAKDTIFDVAGSDFAQEGGDLTAYSGSVNLATGAMTLVTGDFASGAGRRGAIDQGDPANGCGGSVPVQSLCDQIWNKDDVGDSQEYATFRTSSAGTDTTTINGAVLTSIGDVNADGLTDYQAVLVSGGDYGTAFSPYTGNDYYEVWSVQLLSTTAVPVPAAVWLFGSGLLGFVGLARRKAK